MNAPGIPLVLLGGVGLIVLLWFLATYNRFVRLRQHIRESWHNIDVQLSRRYDLIPNLVETVKGYAKHERDLLESLVRARTQAAANRGPVASQERDERPVVSGLRQLLALQEAYPDLKADRQFSQLQEELSDTEDRIAAARRFYNGNVREFNTRCRSVPSNLIAGMFGFSPETFWQVEEASHRERPDVST